MDPPLLRGQRLCRRCTPGKRSGVDDGSPRSASRRIPCPGGHIQTAAKSTPAADPACRSSAACGGGVPRAGGAAALRIGSRREAHPRAATDVTLRAHPHPQHEPRADQRRAGRRFLHPRCRVDRRGRAGAADERGAARDGEAVSGCGGPCRGTSRCRPRRELGPQRNRSAPAFPPRAQHKRRRSQPTAHTSPRHPAGRVSSSPLARSLDRRMSCAWSSRPCPPTSRRRAARSRGSSGSRTTSGGQQRRARPRRLRGRRLSVSAGCMLQLKHGDSQQS